MTGSCAVNEERSGGDHEYHAIDCLSVIFITDLTRVVLTELKENEP